MTPGRFSVFCELRVQHGAFGACPGVFLYYGENRPMFGAMLCSSSHCKYNYKRFSSLILPCSVRVIMI